MKEMVKLRTKNKDKKFLFKMVNRLKYTYMRIFNDLNLVSKRTKNFYIGKWTPLKNNKINIRINLDCKGLIDYCNALASMYLIPEFENPNEIDLKSLWNKLNKFEDRFIEGLYDFINDIFLIEYLCSTCLSLNKPLCSLNKDLKNQEGDCISSFIVDKMYNLLNEDSEVIIDKEF